MALYRISTPNLDRCPNACVLYNNLVSAILFVLCQPQIGSRDRRCHFFYRFLKKWFIDGVDLAFPAIASNILGHGNRNRIGANSHLFHGPGGYTCVGKATREVSVPALQHEGQIYGRLQSLEGRLIPVYLGNIDLQRPWARFTCSTHLYASDVVGR